MHDCRELGHHLIHLPSATNSESVIAVWFADVTPSAVHVGNIVQGARMAWAMGRDIGVIDDESDQAKKVRLAFL